jgi:hypothetical protein
MRPKRRRDDSRAACSRRCGQYRRYPARRHRVARKNRSPARRIDRRSREGTTSPASARVGGWSKETSYRPSGPSRSTGPTAPIAQRLRFIQHRPARALFGWLPRLTCSPNMPPGRSPRTQARDPASLGYGAPASERPTYDCAGARVSRTSPSSSRRTTRCARSSRGFPARAPRRRP